MYGYGDVNEEESRSRDYSKRKGRVKRMIYIMAVILFIASLALVAGCVYVIIERSFISDIMDNQLFTASVWLLIIGGSFLILSIPISGCVGAMREKQNLLITYIAFLSILFLIFLGGTICAVVMREEISSWVGQTMQRSLKYHYGVDLDNTYNRFITQQWDKAQISMSCCGVGRKSWGLYRQSLWYNEQPALFGDPLGQNEKTPMVPVSCCKMNSRGNPVNLDLCQLYTDGPPLMGNSENLNSALNYQGCYDTAMAWLRFNASWIIGVGTSFAALMMFSVGFALYLLLRISK